jgi:surfactin synthase thioesterase subunit
METNTPIVLGLTGLGQLENRLNGVRELEEKLWTILPKSRVFRRKHTAKACQLAKLIRDLWIFAPTTSPVFIYGHSMGGRRGAETCRALKALGVPVRGLGLSDAFGRRLGKRPVVVPANVVECWAFVSTENVIEGSEVRRESEATILYELPPFDVAHAKMSSLPEFHDAIFNAVLAAVRGGG